ncbi:MAG: hypothetical protein ACE5HC_03415 [Candidatus Binatia bacterium]
MNPVFREGIQLYLLEGHGMSAYFYVIIILAPLEFLAIFLPSLDPKTWMGPANLFKISSIAALALIVYFGLKIVTQEIVPWKFRPLKHWIHHGGVGLSKVARGQLALVCFHMLLMILLCTPLLVWAGAVARAAAGTILLTIFFLLFYSISYGVWGLVAVTLWEHRVESRQTFIRCFFVFFVLLSGLVYSPLNPVAFLLSYLRQESMAPLVVFGWRGSLFAVHFLFHIFLLGSALLTYAWALRKAGSL